MKKNIDASLIEIAPLERSIMRLIAQIDEMVVSSESVAPEKIEKLAKSICSQIKALHEIRAYNQDHSESTSFGPQSQKDFTPYEQLPPPTPEEQKEFIERLLLLYNRINEPGPVSEISKPNEPE